MAATTRFAPEQFEEMSRFLRGDDDPEAAAMLNQAAEDLRLLHRVREWAKADQNSALYEEEDAKNDLRAILGED